MNEFRTWTNTEKKSVHFNKLYSPKDISCISVNIFSQFLSWYAVSSSSDIVIGFPHGYIDTHFVIG